MTTTSIGSLVAGTDIPVQPTSRDTESVQTPLLDLATRQWYKATGRAIGSAGDLVSGTSAGTSVRAALPVQVLTVVELRVRAALETSVRGAELHPHVAAAVSAALTVLGAGEAEVQVLSLRTDLPHVDGTDRTFVEAVAAVRGVCSALKVEMSAPEISRLAASVLPEGSASSLALPGLQLVDATGAPVTTWSWWPQYAVVRILPLTGEVVATDHGDVSKLVKRLEASVASRSSVEFAAAVTAASKTLTDHPAAGLVKEALEALAHEDISSPLGWTLSTRGPVAALLYPADMDGRFVASTATRFLSSFLTERAKVAVSISPRSGS